LIIAGDGKVKGGNPSDCPNPFCPVIRVHSKQYLQRSRAIQRKVDKTLLLLDTDFRKTGLRSHPIEGTNRIFEASVDRRYRMTFERNGDTYIMRNVDSHDECLKNP
jgi:hypothetical protein